MRWLRFVGWGVMNVGHFCSKRNWVIHNLKKGVKHGCEEDFDDCW
jgi:hypothetical protein